MKDKANYTDTSSYDQQGEAQEANNRLKTTILRDKANMLLKLGISQSYMRLLLKQKSITKEDKNYIERIYGVIT